MTEAEKLLQTATEEVREASAHLKEVRTEIVAEARSIMDTATADIRSDLKEREAKIKDDLVPAMLKEQEARIAKEREESDEDLLTRIDEINTNLELLKRGGLEASTFGVAEKAERDDWESFVRFGEMRVEGKRFMEGAQTRALSEGTGTEGGFLVPQPIELDMVKNLVDIDPVLEVARVFTLTKGNSITLPKRTSGPTAQKTGEKARPTKSSSAYGFVTRTVHPASVETESSIDFLRDVAEAERMVVEDAVEAIQYLMGSKFILGTDVGEPEGIATNGSIVTVTGTNTTSHKVSGEDFYKLLTTLNSRFRKNGTFLFNSTVLYNALSLRSGLTAAGGGTANEAFLLPVSLRDGVPEAIAGKPFKVCESIADDGTQNNLAVYFGDFDKGYFVTLRDGIELTRDPYSNKPNVEFLWRTRYDGFVADDAAIKMLKMG